MIASVGVLFISVPVGCREFRLFYPKRHAMAETGTEEPQSIKWTNRLLTIIRVNGSINPHLYC
jgi:hypothetical protein